MAIEMTKDEKKKNFQRWAMKNFFIGNMKSQACAIVALSLKSKKNIRFLLGFILL